ncbi:MAG: maleylpyruvate isomerase N-terminal domain-containing protein [Acidimicrobiia bacterium]
MDCRKIAYDLRSEQAALDEIVSELTDEQWQLPTPSPGWTVLDQIAHLAYFDCSAALAISTPADFAHEVEMLSAAILDGGTAVDEFTLAPLRALPSAELLERWRKGRRLLATAAATLTDTNRVVPRSAIFLRCSGHGCLRSNPSITHSACWPADGA